MILKDFAIQGFTQTKDSGSQHVYFLLNMFVQGIPESGSWFVRLINTLLSGTLCFSTQFAS